MASLFSSQVPAARDAADGTDSYSMGTYFTPAVDGTVTAIRWWFPQSGQPGGAAVKANLFRTSDSAKLGGADASFATPGTPDTWNQVSLSSPVAVVAGTQYCATIRTPLRYVASTAGSSPASPWPLTNGDLSTPTNAGRFTSGASGNVDFPSSSFNSGCYFVDVVFTPDSDDTTLEAAITLPALQATGALTAQSAIETAFSLPALQASGVLASSSTLAMTVTLPALQASAALAAASVLASALALPALDLSAALDADAPAEPTSSPTAPISTASRPFLVTTISRERVISTGNAGGS